VKFNVSETARKVRSWSGSNTAILRLGRWPADLRHHHTIITEHDRSHCRYHLKKSRREP